MNFNKMSHSTFETKKNSRLRNRRGITDIISTMMLMAVTVTGASTLTYFMNDAFISGNLGTISTLDSSSLNLLLLAYDTRDSDSLLTLLNVDNNFSGDLCGSGCSGNTNNIPTDALGGTEFIVLQIQNNGIETIFLNDMTINNVVHNWDLETATIPLDASVSYVPNVDRPYPSDGTFSILPVGKSPIIQKENNHIQSGEIVNLLIKLGADDSDILLNKGINVFLDVGSTHTVNFLINSGDAQ